VDPQETPFILGTVSTERVVYEESAALATALSHCFVSAGTCLPSRCLTVDVSSGSTITTFERHVTIYGLILLMLKAHSTKLGISFSCMSLSILITETVQNNILMTDSDCDSPDMQCTT
jgi:hypothetical protein